MVVTAMENTCLYLTYESKDAIEMKKPLYNRLITLTLTVK